MTQTRSEAPLYPPPENAESRLQEDVHVGRPDPVCVLAEYLEPEACLLAAERVREAGYRRWDVHSPYPVHGMDQAMGLKPTRLGWISMAFGMAGCLSAVVMIQWMNAVDYPLVVGGKPPGAVPSMIPIMFELSILLTGFATVFGMLGLCRLPRHHHPVFYSERFQAFSDDKFFISIEASDPKFNAEETCAWLKAGQAHHVEIVHGEA